MDYGALARQFGGSAVEDDAERQPLIPGNIDLGNRPRVRNADGSMSTVRSIGVNMDGREYLLPTVSDDGRILTNDQAIEQFRRTGNHLGAYRTVADSNAAAKRIHEDQETMAAFDGMRPMVAHTPRGKVVDFAALAKKFGGEVAEDEDVGTLNEELHTPPIGIDPRLEPESMMNEAQAAEIPGQIAGGYANYAAMAGAPTLMRGGQAIVSGAASSRLRPIIQGAAIGGGSAVLSGGDVSQGILTGAVAGAAGIGPATAARTAVREAAPDAAALLKVARSAAASTAERKAARTALQKMGWVPEVSVPVPVVKQAVKTLENRAKMPVEGNVVMPSISTKPNPAQGLKPLTEMQIVTRGRQEEAAKAAGLDLGEVFGGTAPAATKAVSKGHQVAARHKALMTLGKEAAMRNPKVGEKIWILLDEAGNPVKQLTPGEAAAAARKGSQTTWVRNLWTN